MSKRKFIKGDFLGWGVDSVMAANLKCCIICYPYRKRKSKRLQSCPLFNKDTQGNFFIYMDYFVTNDLMLNSTDIPEQVTTLEEYCTIVEAYSANNDEVYYRGQSGEYHDITPSIARDDGYLEKESQIFSEVAMRPEFKNLDSPLEKLSLMQHNHIPTRLVDVSKNPLVALYFAVENTEKKHPGRVYIYTEKGYDIDDKRVKALSFLATIQDYSLDDICRRFSNELGEPITPKEFLLLIKEPVLIKHSYELESSNLRLGHQKGTFIICNNVIKNGKILRKLDSLKSIKPTVVINIPYEYKKQIKNQLEKSSDINELKIYPELPTVGSYIKDKYRMNNFSPDGRYSILEKKDVSIAVAKRISFVISLLSDLEIEQIRIVTRDLIAKYKQEYDVIWVYVAKTSDDYIMRNWILSAQWINPGLDDKFKPIPFKNDYGDGHYFGDHAYWSFLNEYLRKEFDSDKTLFICHEWLYNTIHPIYQELETENKNYVKESMLTSIEKHKKTLQKTEKIIRTLGMSHSTKFNDFLANYNSAVIYMNNLIIIAGNKRYNDNNLRLNIKSTLEHAKKRLDIIKKEKKKWREELHLTDLE